MAIKDVLQLGNVILRSSASEVTDILSENVQAQIQDIIDTHRNLGGGGGLAGPQIGIPLRIFVTELPEGPTRSGDQADELRVYINPMITFESIELIQLFESCWSVANSELCLPIIRPRVISIRAFDQNGNYFEITTDGLLARVIQRVNQHLNGVIFIDKATSLKEAVNYENYRIIIKDRKDLVEARKINFKNVEFLSAPSK